MLQLRITSLKKSINNYCTETCLNHRPPYLLLSHSFLSSLWNLYILYFTTLKVHVCIYFSSSFHCLTLWNEDFYKYLVCNYLSPKAAQVPFPMLILLFYLFWFFKDMLAFSYASKSICLPHIFQCDLHCEAWSCEVFSATCYFPDILLCCQFHYANNCYQIQTCDPFMLL